MKEDSSILTPEQVVGVNKTKQSLGNRLFKFTGATLALLVILFLLSYYYLNNLNQPPTSFPINNPVTIEKGTEIRAITEQLESAGVIKSDSLLYYVLIFFHDPTDVKASTYIFDKSLTTREVAEALTRGDFDNDLIRFTHFEGQRATHIAKQAEAVLPNFDSSEFIATAEPLEGKLFPDTYFIPDTYTHVELLDLLRETFNTKTEPLQSQIENSPLTESEVLVLASIIEREANSPESMRLVSGILQNRIAIDMPLQADASIEYILDKPLAELTPEDLKIDSPYNTYLNLGLPPTPIGNPGLEAIKAVLEPTQSDYYYYITGNDGEFYYAESYNQHLVNIERHLR